MIDSIFIKFVLLDTKPTQMFTNSMETAFEYEVNGILFHRRLLIHKDLYDAAVMNRRIEKYGFKIDDIVLYGMYLSMSERGLCKWGLDESTNAMPHHYHFIGMVNDSFKLNESIISPIHMSSCAEYKEICTIEVPFLNIQIDPNYNIGYNIYVDIINNPKYVEDAIMKELDKKEENKNE